MVEKTNLSTNEIVDSWMDKFHFKEAKGATPGLRSPQIGALHAMLSHLSCGVKERGIIVMPTGTGKTETMLSFLVAHQCKKVLVIVPSDALRTQIGDKFRELGILRFLKVIDQDTVNPKVLTIKKSLTHEEWDKAIDENNVIVTTMSLAAKVSINTIRLISEKISYLFVDEAHHSEATTWNHFIDEFGPEQVFLFTATPFRNDGKKLDGKIIFNYPLRKAQEEGYYKPIRFIPIISYNTEDGDKAIAKKAVEILKEDNKNGYEHILMARCKSKKRAEEVFEYYKTYEEFKPVMIYSNSQDKKAILEEIKAGEHRIIVCVNMLGEGFDLPQLKIAAIHDERQSLPVTLQFIGRFTRNSKLKLGEASFVTNIAYPPIEAEINQLYESDADWNELLPKISDGRTEEERSVKEFLQKFKGNLIDDISIDCIQPTMCAEIYTTTDNTVNYNKWKDGIPGISSYKYQRSAKMDDMLVIVLGHTQRPDWSTMDKIHNLSWQLIIVYYDALHKRIYLNSTIGLNGEKFLRPMFGLVSKINGDNLFRIFANTNQLVLYNVGARLRGRDISFQSFFGSSVQDGIERLKQGDLIKNNLFGIGYRDGERVSLGCSLKGRVWSRERDDLMHYALWCNEIGAYVFDSTIDTNTVLKNTLKIESITSYPTNAVPLGFDWSEHIYERGTLLIQKGKEAVPFEDCTVDVQAIEGFANGLTFIIENERFTLQIQSNIDNSGRCTYKEISDTGTPAVFSVGNTCYNVNDFFQEYEPKVFYSDDSVLFGTHLCRPSSAAPQIDNDLISTINWSGTKLGIESQESYPYKTDSIQYKVSQEIMSNFKYLIDDDGSGEVADLVGFNYNDTQIDITLFHLKYAIGGQVSNKIDNLYQVCGQAIKSIRWKYKNGGRKLFEKILERNERKINSNRSSSILKGTAKDIIRLKEQVAFRKVLRFHVVIVQPGMSKSKCTEEMRILLGNVAQYLAQTSGIDLKIICSE
jgi:superfamily II DNA or RNA helicase